MINNQYAQVSKKYRNECKKLVTEEKEYHEGWYSHDFSKLTDVFPKILRYSLFTTVMTIVETDLYVLCTTMQRAINIENEFKKTN